MANLGGDKIISDLIPYLLSKNYFNFLKFYRNVTK